MVNRIQAVSQYTAACFRPWSKASVSRLCKSDLGSEYVLGFPVRSAHVTIARVHCVEEALWGKDHVGGVYQK